MNPNQFFTSVGAKASQDSQSLIDLHNLDPPLPRTPKLYIPEANKFHFHAISSSEVQKVVISFPSDKAPGCDKIPMSVIKDALPCILPILTLIVNRSLLSSVFPVAWKIAEVVPLPKDGDDEMAHNNRPVSLQPRTQGFIFAPVALPLRKNPGPGWSRASQNVGSNNYLTSGRGG